MDLTKLFMCGCVCECICGVFVVFVTTVRSGRNRVKDGEVEVQTGDGSENAHCRPRSNSGPVCLTKS